jgi:hypothetical protein
MSPLFLVLLACDAGKAVYDEEGFQTEVNYTLTITEPEYGEFYQEGPIPVSGVVSPYIETILIEDQEIAVNEDGTFEGEVPFVKEYEIVEVMVGTTRERIPVFAGNSPMETWPGGMAARVLPNGLDALGKQLGSMIDSTGWFETIADQLPEIDNGSWGMRPVAVLQDPTEVALSTSPSGVEVDFTLNGVGIEYEIWWNGALGVGSESVIIEFQTIAIGATADPILDENGILTFSLYDADLTMDDPDFIFGQNNAVILETILELGSQWILEPIGETLLDTIMGELGTLELGGPFAFETDFLGSPMGIALDELYGDQDGLALELEVALGNGLEENASYVPIPTANDAQEGAQFAIAVHEGILDQLLSKELLSTFTQDLDLSGFAGDIIGNAVITLPGGDEAPDADGWCLTLNPGDASVVRMQEGIEPLAYLYLPDMIINVGVDTGSGCTDWLVMSLAAEIGVEISEGTKIGIDMNVGEGAVLYYGATEFEEDAVIEGFGSYLSTLLSLFGGFAEFDLADMLGGADLGLGLEDFSIEILDSQKIYDFYDEWPEGLFSLSVNLWDVSETSE